MREITKVSDINVDDLADYLRIEELTGADIQMLNNLIEIAKKYISSYTGRTEEELDNYQDFVIVALVLAQDMYDNRTMYVERKDVNSIVQNILDMHSVNLL